MKTFLTTLGLTAFLAVAIFTSRVFAQDENSFVPAPDQPLFQANTPQPTFAADRAPSQTTAQSPAQSQGTNSITFQDFYNQLSPYGTWIQTDNYGDVWQPNEHDSSWRPYTYGHWVNSNAGMMWVSDEPFGWATYHYGRWVNLADHGWVWVPGYTWAPAWVSWRDGNNIGNANNTSEAIDTSDTSDYGDYCGWAPLPPDTMLGIDFFDPGIFGWFGDWFGPNWGWGSYWGCNIGGNCDPAYGIGPGCYNFCPAAYMGDPHPWRHFADRRDNFAIINHTRNVTNLNVSNDPASGQFGRVHSDGPGSAALVRSRTPVENVRLTSTSSLAANDRGGGGSLAVYAPDVQNRAGVHPSRVSENLGNVTVNHGTNIAQPLAVNSHLPGAAPTTDQIHAARLADNNAPVSAKIAHADTEFTRTMNEPLSSFHPGSTAGSNFRPATTSSTAGTSTPSTFHASNASSSAFTGEPATHHTSTASNSSTYFGGLFHRFSSSEGSTAHTSVYHSSPSPSYHSSYGSSSFSSIFHSSSSSYHPQPSSHFSSPSAHYGGGVSSFHFSGGGGGHSFGGGHSSGGGGQSSGGGHNGGGNNQQHH